MIEIQKEIKKFENKLGKINENNLVCFKLKYDFSKIKDIQYNLFYKNKIVEITDEILSGFIYIIYNEINKEFINDFKIIEIKNEKKIEEEKNEKEIEEDKKFF